MKERDLFAGMKDSTVVRIVARTDMHIINTHVLEKKAIDLGQPISNSSEAKQSDYTDYRSNIFLTAFKANPDVKKKSWYQMGRWRFRSDLYSMRYQL